MPLGLGLASSHAPSMFAEPEDWPRLHATMTRGVPQPPQIEQETPEVIDSYVRRIREGFATLRDRLEAYRPDAVIIVGDDQREVFSKALTPQLAILVADQVAGSTNLGLLGQPLDQNHVTVNCHRELAQYLLERLVARRFDVGFVEELTPLARPQAGLGHAFVRIANVMGLHETGLPTVMFFVNAYHPPMPSAARCYELGQALREVLAERPERVAIYGSGGLSHNPMGPRAGWVDEPLDHWVLDCLARGEGERLQSLFTFDSDTLRGGTGEIRSWITVAGAFPGVPAEVVEYVPARHAVTGLGFACWQPE
jgi:protocatechuate 4,5-dioxygenase beta chain